jgi:hypothetical protein
MKAEHRKELQTNTLADWLGRTIQRLKEGPSRPFLYFLGLVALVVVLFLAWGYFSRSSEETTSARWLEWDGALTVEDLEEFIYEPGALMAAIDNPTEQQKADKITERRRTSAELIEGEDGNFNKNNRGTIQHRVARAQLARLFLLQGSRDIGSRNVGPHDLGYANLNNALKIYKKLIDETSDTPQLQQEALTGAAKACEALQGKLDDARTYYKRLAEEHKNSARGKQAAQSLKRLDEDEKDIAALAEKVGRPQAPSP